jgi:hypothetical protein
MTAIAGTDNSSQRLNFGATSKARGSNGDVCCKKKMLAKLLSGSKKMPGTHRLVYTGDDTWASYATERTGNSKLRYLNAIPQQLTGDYHALAADNGGLNSSGWHSYPVLVTAAEYRV